ncbi:elongation of very long chain fatty acids protein 6-like protein [Dinothrombium tinctorium]|uniref:Elongation of very long chain fatty acids protein n=1 Tax=Dinothrombium tinctorium TaxID=1965070 RepID=A0A3S3S395_9ACAR|nr:elongation of very long chain fatty acids protein 6-like protein [Dinothrombium tinctorium]
MKLIPDLIDAWYTRGFFFSICNASFRDDASIQFWMWLFTWSKVVELIDTLFVVLRKQKFIHLHWIHHALTVIYLFIAFADSPAYCRPLIPINFVIHFFMYSYYALRASGIRTPKICSIAITSSQIVQMVFGFLITFTASFYFITGNTCDLTAKSAIISLFSLGLFLILFLNFFFHSYLRENSKFSSPQKVD